MVVVPLVSVLLLLYFSAYAAADQNSRMAETSSTPQLVGTLLMFSFLPTYFTAMLIVLWFQTNSVLEQLAPHALVEDVARSRRRLNHLHPLGLLLVLVGIAYGAWQNQFLLVHVLATGVNLLDCVVLFGNCLVWAMVGLIFAWTVPLSASLSRLGRGMRVDLYRLDRVRPLGRLATYSVLTVAGSMAFMPLQALDAEFRWVNYEAGLTVGVPAAIGLFLLPLIGVRNNIRERKRERLEVLNARIDEIARDDVAQLETIAAHVERIRNLPNWPLDLANMTRLLGYVVIPPLAWVGAALVENLVDRFAT